MVIRYFLILIFYVVYGFAIECFDNNINRSDNVLIIDNGSEKQEVSLDSPIENVSCFYNKYLSIVTKKFVYIATKQDGLELLHKIILEPNEHFYMKQGNALYFQSDDNLKQIDIDKRGNFSIKNILVSIEQKPLFLSFNQNQDEVVFQKNYLNIKNKRFKIVILYKNEQSLYYYFVDEKKFYMADKTFYKHSIKSITVKKLFDKQGFYNIFSSLSPSDMKKTILYFKDTAIKAELLAIYIKKGIIDRDFIYKIVGNDFKEFYKVLKNKKAIFIPSFGKYTDNNIKQLKSKLKEFKKTISWFFIKNAGVLTIDIEYPSKLKYKVYIASYIENKRFFKIFLQPKCHFFNKSKEEGYRSKGFLFFTTVEYRSMFEVKKYHCKIDKTDLKNLQNIFAILDKQISLRNNWEIKERKLLYDISSKQTEFGKAMSQILSGSQKCNTVAQECQKNCKYKNDKNGFFIFTSSDKERCKQRCIDAKYYCNKGKITKMEQNICKAKCSGYDTSNGGLFSSSDYEKCYDNCMR